MKKSLLTLLIAFSTMLLQAAAPSWSVSPGAYNYNMTITAVLNVNCTDLTNPSNILGAFIDGEERGVAFSSTVVNDQFIAMLTVYSNVASGDTVTFKIYNASTDQIIDAKTTVLFQDDAVYGTPTVPYKVVTNTPPSDLTISNELIQENVVIGTSVGQLQAIDSDGAAYTYTFVSGTGSIDNTSFAIVSDQLNTNTSINFEEKNDYSVRVKADDGTGCAIEKEFTFAVVNVNDTPSGIILSNDRVDENIGASDQVGVFTTTDEDVNQTFTYTLVAGAGDVDNSFFALQGDKLVANQKLDFEVQASYQIRIQTRDSGGETFESNFTINLNDINDVPTGVNLSVDSITENNKIGQTIGLLTAVDQDAGDTHSFAFKDIPGSNNDDFFIVGNQLKTSIVFDYETINEYFVYVSTIDSKGESYFSLFTIKVLNGNDAPTGVNITNSSVSENRPVGTFIGTLSTSDLDEGQTHIYSLVNGAGDVNNSSFILRDDSLFSNEVFDISVKETYSLRVQTDDQNGATYSESFEIFVKDVNNDPTDIFLDNNNVAEDAALSTIVGSFTAADADLGDGHTFKLVAGSGDTDNSSFIISSNSLKTNVLFDYETKSLYTIRVEANDGFGGRFEKEFEVKISNGNDAPTDVLLSNLIIAENLNQGTLVGVLTTEDKDALDTHTYKFVTEGSNNNDSFVISGDQLLTGESFDFETKKLYFIAIRSEDGKGGAIEKQFTIQIKDTSDAPHDILITSNEVQEDQPKGTAVGVLSTEDVDAGDQFTYSFTTGSGAVDNAKFFINGDTLKTNEVFDLPVNQTLKVRIKSTDNSGLSTEKAFVISVLDVNDAPTGITLLTATVGENNSLGQVISKLTTTDPDGANTHTYSLVAGTGDVDNSSFIISADELKANSIFDFEDKASYSIRISTQDDFGATFEKQFTITIEDGNDDPTDVQLSNLIIAENLNQGAIVGAFTTEDKDASDTHTYKLVEGGNNNNDSFVINGNQLLTAEAFDFETKKLYFIAIRSEDGKGGAIEKQFTIQIKDTNDAPHDILITSNEVDEDQPQGTVVGVLSTEDVDAGDQFTYSFTTGSGAVDNAKFLIDGDTLKTKAIFDLPVNQTLKVRLKSTDNNGLSTEKAFVISVLDINDAPTGVTLLNTSIAENNLLGEVIGKFTSTDPDAGNTHTYSLVAGTGDVDNSSFIISADELKANNVFDFEGKASYSIRVSTQDNFGASFEKQFTITIEDGNDAPTDISLLVSNVAENMSVGTVVTKIKTTDQDVTNTHFYSFENLSGNSNDLFIIFGDELRTNKSFNYEEKSQYIVALKTTDPYGISFVKQFTISIDDANDAPIGLSLSDSIIPEKEPIGTYIGMFSTQDPDQIDTLTYSLVSGAFDNSSFSLDENNLQSAKEFDYNTKNSYSILVRTTDKQGLYFDKKFVIAIENVNGAPTQINLSSQEIDENILFGETVALLTAEDEDENDVHTYKLVSGNGAEDNSKFKIEGASLVTNTTFNFEVKSVYNILLQVSDQSGNTFDQKIAILVNDVNERPVAYEEEFSVSESAETNTVIGNVRAEDEDNNQTLTYQLVKVKGETSVFKVDVVTGEISLLTAKLDYEDVNTYEIDVVVSDNGVPVLSDTVTLTIYVEDEIEGFLPSVDYISPNGDGINDTWVINNISLYDNYKIMIFNAVGSLLYAVDNGYDNSWNGSYNGKELPTGTYYYIMSDNDDSAKIFKGTISLVR